MTTHTDLHPLAQSYLERLYDAARTLPPDQAAELVSDITDHLREAVAPSAGEAEVRTVLDRLGTPQELVAAAGGAPEPTPPAQGPRQVGVVESVSLVLLVVAELLFFLSLFMVPIWVIGLVLMAASRVWTGREKVRGLLAIGTGFPVVFATVMLPVGPSTVSSCSGASTVTTAGDARADQGADMVCTSSGGWPDWAYLVALGLMLAYLVFQVWTLWRLTRRR